MNFSYDESLKNITINVEGKSINFFKIHPELLPYVGDEYDKTKLLMIGESHYLSEGYDENNIKKAFSKWYSSDCRQVINQVAMKNNLKPIWFIKDEFMGWNENWKNTGYINGWSQAIDGCNTRGICNGQGISIINFNMNYFKKAGGSGDLYPKLAFMNYFQRPNLRPGTFEDTLGTRTVRKLQTRVSV